MQIVFLWISVLVTFLFPFLSIPFNLLGMVLSGGKIRKTHAFLLAISLALLAYIWTPDASADLYVHHRQVSRLADFDFEQLGFYIRTNLEPVQYIIKFIVAQTGVNDLLQFVVILCGYFELFWLISDLADLRQLKKSVVLLLLLYGFFAVRFIDFASGLWFNFAIINIALGVYLKFFKKTKYFQYILYIVAVFSHIGTLYMLLVMLIFSKVKLFKKVRLPIVVGVLVLALSFSGIVVLINNLLGDNSVIVDIINNMYDAYFINGSQFAGLHTGWNLILRWAILIICIVLAAYYSRDKNVILSGYSSFLLYLTLYIAVTMVNAGVFSRYGFFVAILSLPLIAEFLMNAKNKQTILLLVTVIIAIVGAESSRWYSQVETSGLSETTKGMLVDNVVQIIDSKGSI